MVQEEQRKEGGKREVRAGGVVEISAGMLGSLFVFFILAVGLMAAAYYTGGNNLWRGSVNNTNNTLPGITESGSSSVPEQGGASGLEEITKEQAASIATEKYGGEVKEVENDHYHGIPAWEVELKNSSQGRIEVKVEKSSGKILEVEPD